MTGGSMPFDCTDEVFIETVKAASSAHAVIRLLGRAKGAFNYRLVREAVSRLALDTTHWVRPPRLRVTLSLVDVLVEHSIHSTGLVKQKLLQGGVLDYYCVGCGLSGFWNGKPLVLRLDHINGVRDDHRLENLRLLCPNCDSQMDTFCGRNMKKKKATRQCPCGKVIEAISQRCDKCNRQLQRGPHPEAWKIPWPEVKELRQRIAASSVLAVSKELGVSDKAVCKHLARHT